MKYSAFLLLFCATTSSAEAVTSRLASDLRRSDNAWIHHYASAIPVSGQRIMKERSMPMRALLLAVAFGLSLAVPSVGSARRIEHWPYDRLMKESDLVVIARAVSSVDCDDTIDDESWGVTFFGIETSFEVLLVLKGAADENVKVLHYRLDPGLALQNGPLLVSFRTGGMRFDLKHALVALERPDYMLFLKRRPDGRYEPVSGRIDPQLSVRALYRDLSGLDKIQESP